MSDFRWASVTALGPLRIKLDGDSAALVLTPEALVDPAALLVGSRVRVELYDRRILIVGLGGGMLLASSAETITGADASKIVTPAGLAALTSTDLRRGLVELATTAEATTGTDTARAVTPAGLAAGLEDRPGWQRVVPTSIASSGSTATYNSTTGLITMPAACTMVRANGVFVAGYEYLIVTKEVDAFTVSTDQMLMRFCTGGTANTTAVYYTVGRYTQYDGTSGNWINNATTYASQGIGYTTGGHVRREWQIMGAFETENTYIKGQWSYSIGTAREIVSSGSFNQTTSFDGYQIYSATGSFQGTMQIWRRKAMAI